MRERKSRTTRTQERIETQEAYYPDPDLLAAYSQALPQLREALGAAATPSALADVVRSANLRAQVAKSRAAINYLFRDSERAFLGIKYDALLRAVDVRQQYPYEIRIGLSEEPDELGRTWEMLTFEFGDEVKGQRVYRTVTGMKNLTDRVGDPEELRSRLEPYDMLVQPIWEAPKFSERFLES